MNCTKNSLEFLRKPFLLLLVMAVPVFAGAQKPAPKPPAPAPKPAAPAARPAAPAQRPQAPAAQHPGTARPSTPGQRPGATGTQGQNQRPGTNQSGQNHGTGKPGGDQHSGKPGDQGKTQPPKTGQKGPEPNKTEASRGSHQAPGKSVTLKSGTVAHVRPDGKIRSLDTKNGMHIEHNLHGQRTIASDRNGAHVVTTGKDKGYYQRRYATRNGHVYYARTYMDHGVYRTAVYRGYTFGGAHYYAYAPGFYYSPAFYGWAYGGWPAPVAYGWGWAGASWYGFYGFTPYAAYAAPAYWLTDYLIAANLQAAYAAASAGPVAGGINVDVTQPWTDTGTQIVQGQTYSIAASGLVSYQTSNPNANVSPAGDGRPTCFTNPQPTAPNLPCLSLIGKIGPAGIPFFVGPGKTFVAPAGGELFLGMNDSYFPDNGGNWAVSVNQPGGGDSPSADPQQGDPQPSGNDQVAMAPEVKEQLVQEVKSDLKSDQDAAAQPKSNSTGMQNAVDENKEEAPPALDPQHLIFVVDTDRAVVTDDGKECSLTAADVLMRMSDSPNQNQEVTARVTASKKADCAVGKTVAVTVDALQDMYNHFHEKLDEGTKELAAKQGKDNLPKAPDTNTVAGEMDTPPADKAATAKALQQQQSEADQAEADAKREIGSSSGS
jgi:hypothetical protein